MYDDIVAYGQSRYAKTNKAFVEAAIADYEESIKPEKSDLDIQMHEDAISSISSTMQRDANINRFIGFCETVRTNLVTETLYRLMSESVDEFERNDRVNASIMRAIVSQYVNENGYDNIMNRMRSASNTMSSMYKVITESAARIIEAADKDDPNTFTVTPEMKDDFFQQLDYSDSQAITDAIHDRVSDAMDDFVTANTKDHEDISAALQQAQDKIAANPAAAEDEELQEYYTMQGKREANKIRNRPKSVLHSMVSAMCESVMKNKDMHPEFMTEGHLNVEKIVSRVKLMYTFMEMLNTARIEKVDEAFIEEVIADLSK